MSVKSELIFEEMSGPADPENLSNEDKVNEFKKCAINPIYFIRNYCYIPHQKHGEILMGDFLYPKQEEFITMMWKDRFTITNKTRQCLAKHNYVTTNRGFISIKDVKPGDMIETIDKETKKPKFVKVLDSWLAGVKETCEVTTVFEHKVICTLDHEFYTKRGWVKAEDLTIDDEIASVDKFQKIKIINKHRQMLEVYDITTESSDFLANGLLVHNCGFSTVIGCFSLWFGLFHINKQVVVVSITDSHSKSFLKRYVNYPYHRLPNWMKSQKVKQGQYQNMHTLGLYNGSEIRCASGKNAARGDSNYIVVIDEVGFLEENLVKDMWSSVYPTIVTGEEGKVILNSTSSAAGTWYHEKWEASLRNESEFKPIEVDWWEVPYLAQNTNYEIDMRRELTPLSRFRREIMREFVVDEDPFIPHEFTEKMNEEDPIRTDFLKPEDYIPPEELDPDEFSKVDGFDAHKNYIKGLWIWKDPMPRHKYILAADTAEGDGQDYSAIQIIDLNTLEQVAEFHNRIDTYSFADIIIKLAFYYNKATVVPEANAAGNAVVSRIEKSFKYENLYYRPLAKGMLGAGFKTTPANRNDILRAYYRALIELKYKTYSKRLKKETRSLITKNNKVQAAQGTHDDLIMAYSIASYLIQENAVHSEVYEMDFSNDGIENEDIINQSPQAIKEYFEKNTEIKIDNSTFQQFKWMF